MDSFKRQELIFRILAGLFLVPVTLYLTIFASRTIFFVIFMLVLLGTVREYIPLIKRNDDFSRILTIWVAALAFPFVVFFGGDKTIPLLLLTIFLVFFIAFLTKLFSDNPTKNVIEDVGTHFLSMVFIPLLFSFMLMIRDVDSLWLVYLFFIVWAADTFAYFVGMSLGKHKLIPLVSPGKTVEGLIGGVVFSLIIAYFFNHFFMHQNIVFIFILVIDVIAAGVIGDLVESMIKRSAEVKDSGNLIPGHGGLLDRFDSMLFAAPVMYFYLYFFLGL